MLKRIATMLWGKFESREEVKKFGMLAGIFGLIIGVYWSLRPIKDSVFNAIVGGHHLWLAKIVSLVVIFPLIILYGKLVDKYPRQKVFYGLIGIYTFLTFGLAWALMHPTMGLPNTVPGMDRYIGWMFYVFVESFGSLIVALFWAFTTDTTGPDAAKRGFPIIALFGQLGNIIGPWFLNAQMLGFANSGPVVAILGVLMAVTGVLFWVFMRVTPKSQLVGYKSEKEENNTEKSEPGFLEGLKLLLTKGYLLGIFTIVTLYELIVTVLDYHFKQTVFATFSLEKEASAYLSTYASSVGVVATLCVLFGINNITRKLGMRASLVLLPVLILAAVTTIYFNPSALTIAMWIMIMAKAINYALNQPTLKMLYIPTTQDTKYKSQAWIEMFGSRSSKAAASGYNYFRGAWGLTAFMTTTMVLSSGLVAAWILVAIYVAHTYTQAVEADEVVC